METLQRILAEHPFMEGMDERCLTLMVGCASNVRFDAGKVLIREGEEASRFYLIREGKVALEVYGSHRGKITIQTLGEGDVLGWSWLIPPYRWKFTARAIEPTRAFAMDGKCLRTKAEEDYALGYDLLNRFSRIIVERLEATTLQLINVYEVPS
jgi:CRP-like cAMP-binding protein